MTNNTSIPAIDDTAALARTAAASYYDDIRTLDDATNYFRAELMIFHTDAIRDRHTLRRALDNDIADLIHNANLSDLLPFADDLSDDDYERYADALDDDFLNHLTMILATRLAI